MKKLIALILSLTFVFAATGCALCEESVPDTTIGELQSGNVHQNRTETFAKQTMLEDKVEIVSIVDYAEDGFHATADALEGFYADDTYYYYFSSIRGGLIIVTFSDGTEMNVREAFGRELITTADLDRFGIGYYKEEIPKIVSIVDKTKTDHTIGVCDAEETFYSDENYNYVFPTIKSQYVIVYLHTGVEMNVKGALETGCIKITDLDSYDIDYYKVDRNTGEYID